ncbi:hypothetical protein, partial [Pseudomonas aeruginosa]|uniref:hypothetical protein n=1 Tax=Pseudomonas aeruginosa TaxID=287 RepID=UPI003F1C2998
MIDRCTNPSNKRYVDYQGRGITVCERWMTFANFLADMGERPDATSLDRIDNDAGYFKEKGIRKSRLMKGVSTRLPKVVG